jgi:predicted porin
MTLLGVGLAGQRSGGVTTLGGIGSGYIYPAWRGQIAYTTPNMNGFQATIAITNPDQGQDTGNGTVNGGYHQDRFGIEGKASYSWTGDVAGKVWASGATYDVTVDGRAATSQTSSTTSATDDSYTASVYDIGASIAMGNLGLTGYYYNGEGVGTTIMGSLGYNATGTTTGAGKKRDSDGGYVQATYVIPTGTKLGVAYGVSNLDEASGETATALVEKNERWTVGAYHPLTKHLNLVAEYNNVQSEGHSGTDVESDHISLGAILFF